jgi:hypothetical protein
VKKMRLTPQQGKLLALLEEAGAEDLRTVVATLKPTTLDLLDADIRVLVKAGLIEFYRDLAKPGYQYVPLSSGDVADLPALAVCLTKFDPERLTGVRLTEAGMKAVRT